jgi:putrescine transport system ATP-binding protein
LVEHATENRSVAGSIPALGTIFPKEAPPMSSEAGAGHLELADITRRFGPVTAVDGVSLSIRKGEFFSLLGPSGCGKSTLMRMIAGFEQPDAGRIWLDGDDLTALPPHSRPTNMMFQSYALFPHLSVAGNIAFGLKQLGMEPASLQARMREMVRLTQLDGLEDRKPAALSGGQRQRVALARALARNPKVVLLDEPLAALDRKLRKETQAELKRIQAETGATFILVTHDQEEAMGLSDRMAVMRKGKLAQVGTPMDIYNLPANRFTASFIGEVNLIPAKPLADGRFEVSGLSGAMAVGAAESARQGDVSLAVRPERLIVTPDRRIDLPGWLTTVVSRTLLGQATSLELADQNGLRLKALVQTDDPAAMLRPGDPAFASFRLGDARVLGD